MADVQPYARTKKQELQRYSDNREVPKPKADGSRVGQCDRHVGFAYIVFGFALNWCALQLEYRRPVFLMVSFFMVVHALGHVVEILIGLLPITHWWIDFPLVLFPGLILGVLAIPRVWASLVGDSGAGKQTGALR